MTIQLVTSSQDQLRPGTAGTCPSCGQQSLVISRKDDQIGQCYSAKCGLRRRIKVEPAGLDTLFLRVYSDFHRALLGSEGDSARSRLIEAGVHEHVIAHSMTGIVQRDYDPNLVFRQAIEEAETCAAMCSSRRSSTPSPAVQIRGRRLTGCGQVR